MSKKSGEPEKEQVEPSEPVKPTVSQSFDISERLGSIQGLLEGLVSRTRRSESTILESVDQVSGSVHSLNITSMAAKNKLTFSGRQNESAADFIKEIKYLKMANGWNLEKTVGNVLVSLKSDAKKWFERLGAEHFYAEGGTAIDFDIFETKFLERFKDDLSTSDLISDVLSMSQSRGQCVDDYLALVFKKLAKLTELTEEVKVGLVINGFLPTIRQNLVLKDIKTLSDLELWSRRLERVHMVQKSDIHTVEGTDVDVVTSDNVPATSGGAKSNYHVPPVPAANKKYLARPQQVAVSQRGQFKQYTPHQGMRGAATSSGRQPGPCWSCGGPHLKSQCRAQRSGGRYVAMPNAPANSYRGRGNVQARPWNPSRGGFRGRGRGGHLN